LIQVRDELQKSKAEMTSAENTAINNWRTKKISLRDAINDMKIEWQNKYTQKSQLWKTYGDEFVAEGQAMLKFANAKAQEDTNQINLDFEKVVCKDQDDDYKAQSKKRYGQLEQIKKVLELLSKFGLSDKYGAMVRDTIKEVNAGLCRAFDDNSTFVSVAPTSVTISAGKTFTLPNVTDAENAWKVYSEKDSLGQNAICVSQIQYSFVCTGACDMRTNDQAVPTGSYPEPTYPRINYISDSKLFGITQVTTLRLDKPHFWSAFQTKAVSVAAGATATQTDVSIFVVPACNCDPTRNKLLDVTANAAKNNETQPVGL